VSLIPLVIHPSCATLAKLPPTLATTTYPKVNQIARI
jgi:hypothetical protein